MAPLRSYLSRFFPNFPLRISNYSDGDLPMLLLCSFFVFFTFSVLVLSFSLYKRLRKIEFEHHQQLISKPSEPERIDIGHSLASCGEGTDRRSPACLTHSLLFEILPPDSPKWGSLFDEEGRDDLDSKGSGLNREFGDSGQEQGGKRKKKRAKKKRANSQAEDETDNWGVDSGTGSEQELTLLYPFTSSTSVIQRKIKQQYDELMKCQESKELTLAQVRQFANCLINARSKLQHKADVIHRKFTITKALLYKADRSSFDRLQQQIYKLELEQKRLEEDTFVYNWLQQQLKLSPAYKKMLEIGNCMEIIEKSEKPTENPDSEFTDMSFEELLAQEKKDSFWHRNGKLRSCSS
ncbi:uncharacterized protein LOC111017622 [Momordica charantia]|uniref:Uncharacterized protein LOC111017622 n=1 Tax=Momordica charantia TaxID=3673 RepID=A0A6J1D702_MOMCH|nr:uncharacterized protein LOC111017622 [Momordica charantia]